MAKTIAKRTKRTKTTDKGIKKILLIDVDSSIPNLALMKLSSFYKDKGYKIELMKLNYSGFKEPKRASVIDAKHYDKVFASIIFTVNKDVVKIKGSDVAIGGTGYDLTVRLPDEVEGYEPDFSIYPDNDECIGFTSRGCIRNCSFCFVRRKEGYLHKYDDWRKIKATADKFGLKKIRFLDNNFLANPDCEQTMQELADANIQVSFNEGLDFRLIDDRKAELLSKLNYYPSEYIFAFDNISYMPMIIEKYKIIKRHMPKDWAIKFYCYVNADMPIQDTVQRIEWCRANKTLCFIMRDVNCHSGENREFYSDIATYCQNVAYFKQFTFSQFMKIHTKNPSRILKHVQMYNSNNHNYNNYNYEVAVTPTKTI
jgi:hypothetical protein